MLFGKAVNIENCAACHDQSWWLCYTCYTCYTWIHLAEVDHCAVCTLQMFKLKTFCVLIINMNLQFSSIWEIPSLNTLGSSTPSGSLVCLVATSNGTPNTAFPKNITIIIIYYNSTRHKWHESFAIHEWMK